MIVDDIDLSNVTRDRLEAVLAIVAELHPYTMPIDASFVILPAADWTRLSGAAEAALEKAVTAHEPDEPPQRSPAEIAANREKFAELTAKRAEKRTVRTRKPDPADPIIERGVAAGRTVQQITNDLNESGLLCRGASWYYQAVYARVKAAKLRIAR